MKSSFIFDVIATLPTLCTYEAGTVYFLKVFRFIHLNEALNQINDLLKNLLNRIGVAKQSA